MPKSYKDCNKISNYPTTPLKVTPFQQPYKQAAVKQKSGSTCNGDSCLDVYEIDEVYVPNHELLPSSTCPNGTKMLLYNGMFPGPTVVQPIGHQVRAPTLGCALLAHAGACLPLAALMHCCALPAAHSLLLHLASSFFAASGAHCVVLRSASAEV